MPTTRTWSLRKGQCRPQSDFELTPISSFLSFNLLITNNQYSSDRRNQSNYDQLGEFQEHIVSTKHPKPKEDDDSRCFSIDNVPDNVADCHRDCCAQDPQSELGGISFWMRPCFGTNNSRSRSIVQLSESSRSEP